MKQRSVHRQHLREIRKQSPYSFCIGSVDIKLKISHCKESSIHIGRIVHVKHNNLGPSSAERCERESAALIFPGAPSVKFDPWAPAVLHFALIAKVPADAKPSCIFLRRIVDLENNDLWPAIPI